MDDLAGRVGSVQAGSVAANPGAFARAVGKPVKSFKGWGCGSEESRTISVVGGLCSP